MRFLAILAVTVSVATCGGARQGTADCGREPAGTVKAFFAGEESSRDLTAAVIRVTPLPDIKGFRYELRDQAGAEARLTWIAPDALPVHPGDTYRFVVEYRPGFPDSSGILLFAGERLIFGALTDHALFQQVFVKGIPGFEIAVGDAICSSRGRTSCFESQTSMPLVLSHLGERKTLYQGQVARLGGFTVRALTVQKIAYSSKCADAGIPDISFTISRTE